MRYLRLAARRSAAPARNGGLRAAKHPLVAYLDSDDEWFPDILALQRAVMEARPELVYVFSDFAVRDEGGVEHRRYLSRWQERPRPLAEVLGPGVLFSTLGALPSGRADFPVHVGDLYPAELDDNFVATFTFCVRRGTAHDRSRVRRGPRLLRGLGVLREAREGGPGRRSSTRRRAIQYGHAGPRITKTDPYVMAGARLTMIERLWGRDAEFLARHREAYDGTIAPAPRRSRASGASSVATPAPPATNCGSPAGAAVPAGARPSAGPLRQGGPGGAHGSIGRRLPAAVR